MPTATLRYTPSIKCSYPQYGGKFCQTIVSDDPRSESLIDDFKGDGTNPDLTIAISVDMLDTGVDGLFDEPLADEIFAIIGSFQKVGK